jgi:hypothetical protein
VHFRRVVLLVAIVLGVSAIVASVAPEPRKSGDDAASPAPSPPRDEPGRPKRVTFRAGAKRPPAVRARLGQQVVLEVRVPRPGQVGIEGLGLLQQAEPRTPAVFDVLASRPGRFDAVFAPVEDGEPARVGTLVVLQP